jgi:hypothetical protein
VDEKIETVEDGNFRKSCPWDKNINKLKERYYYEKNGKKPGALLSVILYVNWFGRMC